MLIYLDKNTFSESQYTEAEWKSEIDQTTNMHPSPANSVVIPACNFVLWGVSIHLNVWYLQWASALFMWLYNKRRLYI